MLTNMETVRVIDNDITRDVVASYTMVPVRRLEITINDTPAMGQLSGCCRQAQSEKWSKYIADACDMLAADGYDSEPIDNAVILLYFSEFGRRIRDANNYPLGMIHNILVAANLICDDSSEHMRYGAYLSTLKTKSEKKTNIVIIENRPDAIIADIQAFLRFGCAK